MSAYTRAGFWTSARGARGFNLIEVMIAVVVLATGFLALAALQGALARSSADAKARGAIMSALTSEVHRLRLSPPPAGTTVVRCADEAWICALGNAAGVSDLAITRTIEARSACVSGELGCDAAASNFSRVSIGAAWTDARADSRSLTLVSDSSPEMYRGDLGYPVPDPNGSDGKRPIVRQDNPSLTPGVIPIVTGDQSTAASNPQPIIEGKDGNLRVGTSFDVLTYLPEGATAQIRKRFQTTVIKCRCSFGASGYSVAGAAQWPAVWDGTTYSLYESKSNPAGVAANAGEDPDYAGGKNKGRLQSAQCTECCRDHHDSAVGATEAKFDPEAVGSGKFNLDSGILTPVTTGKYVAACRVVKVDGLWRTTADMYQRHYGLLETTSVDGVQAKVQAKSGLPSQNATTAYQAYVKDYLSKYTSASTIAPEGALAMFDETERGLNPGPILIAEPSTTDYRYLHGRGLYVDYLGSKAQAAIKKCDDKSGAARTECVLAVLPFTTINLTEIAHWKATDSRVLAVNTSNTLYFNVTEPSGGRTAGIRAGEADTNSESRGSNSGVAVSDDIPGAVDMVGDQAVAADSQAFAVGGDPDGSGKDYFKVYLDGPIISSPDMRHTYGNCGKEGDNFQCLSSEILPQDLRLEINRFFTSGGLLSEYDFSGVTCTKKKNGDPAWVAKTYPVPVAYNTLQNLEITEVVIGDGGGVAGFGDPGTVAWIDLTAVPNDGLVTVRYQNEGLPVLPTVKSCVYTEVNSQGNKYLVIDSVIWNEAWAH